MTYIKAITKMTKAKPNNYLNKDYQCPFCDREALRKEGRILRETEDFLVINNKYPVLDNTFSTLIIEHRDCGEHIGTYSIDYLIKLLKFSLDYYNDLLNSGKYASLIFFKNNGLMASGSIEHPHMQIMGLENKTYDKNIKPSDFEGITIRSDEIIDWNFSTKPKSEFYEINLILHKKDRLDVLAACLQKTVNFVLEELNIKYKSYNLAFYISDQDIKVKVFSRQPVTVTLLGYGIHQVPDNLDELAEKLREY